jgi:phosphate transport system permease protein
LTHDRDASSLGRHSRSDQIFQILLACCAAAVLLTLGGLVLTMAFGGTRAFETFGPGFVWHNVWNPVSNTYGALAPLFGTLITTIIGVALALPLAFGAAFWLTTMAPPRIGEIVGTAVQLLAAVPSIIFGMWGLFVIKPIMARDIQPFLTHHLGHVPVVRQIVHGAPFGYGLMTGGIVLAVMITPFIAAVMRDVFMATPPMLRESAFGLGATRWEVMRQVTLPWSRAGVIGGIVLGMGRALGETMAVTFVIGDSNRIGWSLFAPANTVASLIALEFPESPAGSIKLASLLALGFILMLLSFASLAVARLLLRERTA